VGNPPTFSLLYDPCQMLRSAILAAAVLLLAREQPKRYMRVTALEYHKNDSDTPYRMDGETVPPGDVLFYRLGCKKGAGDLRVGERYEIAEGTDAEGTKILNIYYKEPKMENPPVPGAQMIGVVCTVESVRAKRQGG
jgi:hypothetical protein